MCTLPVAVLPAIGERDAGLAGGCASLAGESELGGGSDVQLLSTLFSLSAGMTLIPFVTLLGLCCWLWSRLNRREELQYTAIVAGVASLASLALVTWFGFAQVGDPHRVTWVYLFYGSIAVGRDDCVTIRLDLSVGVRPDVSRRDSGGRIRRLAFAGSGAALGDRVTCSCHLPGRLCRRVEAQAGFFHSIKPSRRCHCRIDGITCLAR